MMREGIPNGRASTSKTTRGQSNVDKRLGEEIEGGREKKHTPYTLTNSKK